MAVDTLLTNARIVDGTGVPWYRGAVGVVDGRIETVFKQSAPSISAAETVDLGEAILAPGFIDTHSHSDLEVFRNPLVTPKIRQGVTTEIVGQDGLSVAPITSGDRAEWAGRMAPLAGTIESEWGWESVGEYMDAVDEVRPALNIGTLVGHGTVRYGVLGMSEAAPSTADLAAMRELVERGLDDGALGFSTGLVYPPQVHSDTQEVRTLAAALQGCGKPFVAHIRGEAHGIWEALDEFVDIGVTEEIPLHVSHLKLAGPKQHGEVDRLLGLLAAARDRGVELTADAYPYTAGNTMLLSVLPAWIQEGETTAVLDALRSDANRNQLKQALRGGGGREWTNLGARVGWENIRVANVSTAQSQSLQDMTIASISADRGTHPVDTVCDILIEEGLAVSMFINHVDQADMERIISHDWVAVATDGIFDDNPHPRAYGTYPLVLGEFVRTRNLLSLEAAVRKMSALPAAAMGLHRKGLVQPGMDADLVVFDPDIVTSRATFERPTRPPQGISAVLVDGTFVVRDFEVTDNRPGGAVRR